MVNKWKEAQSPSNLPLAECKRGISYQEVVEETVFSLAAVRSKGLKNSYPDFLHTGCMSLR